jgi:GNAT superfamily N-acetyltransferase
MGNSAAMTAIRHLSARDFSHLPHSMGRTINRKRFIATKLKAKKRVLLVAEKGGILAGHIEISVVERGWRVRTPLLDWIRFQLLPSYGSQADAVLLPYRYGLIRDVFVVPDQRRAGIGGKLVQAGLEWQRQRGAGNLQAAIPAGHSDLERFFSTLGFEPIQYLVDKRLNREAIPSSSEIQFAGHDDLPQLTELLQKEITYQTELAQRNLTDTFQLVPNMDWESFASAKLKDREVELLLVKGGDQTVGFLEGHLIDGGRRKHGYIEDVYVLPKYRRQGFATALADRCFHWIQSRQGQHIQASIWAGNETSLRFFEGLGFVLVKKMLCKQA